MVTQFTFFTRRHMVARKHSSRSCYKMRSTTLISIARRLSFTTSFSSTSVKMHLSKHLHINWRPSDAINIPSLLAVNDTSTRLHGGTVLPVTIVLMSLQYVIHNKPSHLQTYCFQTIVSKIFSVLPNSMADERTGSYLTWFNSALRANQKVDTLVNTVQVGQWYKTHQPRVSDRLLGFLQSLLFTHCLLDFGEGRKSFSATHR